VPSNKRKLKDRSKLYHEYYKRTGGYVFLGKNFIKLLIVLGIFGVLIYVLSTHVLDLNTIMCDWFDRLPKLLIIATLFISESFLGLIPPDMYIIWAKSLSLPFVFVFILALVSYLGGIISYGYGTLLCRISAVNYWVEEKFSEQFTNIRKFGGLLIFLAAITPLPFSMVSIVAGMVRFPFKLFWTIALARFLRFFIYALLLFSVLQNVNTC
jgi:membrane protein YqaA with SNARE-associated domain